MVHLDDLRAIVGTENPPWTDSLGSALTRAELRALSARPDPLPGLAARLAAKYAALRVLDVEPIQPAPSCALGAVEVLTDPGGRPSLSVDTVALAAALSQERRDPSAGTDAQPASIGDRAGGSPTGVVGAHDGWLVSLSHDGDRGAAVVAISGGRRGRSRSS
ncbi:MAG: hypothetical protein ACK5O2_11365 [Microthrixaceae bacterium]